MKMKKNFKKEAVIVALLLLSISILVPVTCGRTLPNQTRVSDIIKNQDELQTLPKNVMTSPAKDFSIVIHRIKEEDEIDPWPYGEANWQLRMYVEGIRKTLEIDGDNVVVDLTFTWEDIITDETTFVQIKMELLDLDPWPGYQPISSRGA